MKREFKREKAYLSVIDKIIIIVIAFAITIVMGTAITSYKDMETNLLTVYDENLENRVDELVQSFESFFEDKFNNLSYLAIQPEVYKMNWDEQKNFLSDKAKPLGFENVFIMDKNGYGRYVKQDVVKNQSDEIFYHNVMDNDKYITTPFMELQRSITTLSVSILDEKGNKVGAMCGTINLEKINLKIEDFKLGKEGFGILINEIGQYMACKDMLLVSNNENFITNYCGKDDDLSLLDNRDELLSATGKIVLDGVSYRAAYKQLNVNDWIVVILVPEGEVLTELSAYTKMQILNVAVVVLLILLVAKIMYNWIYNEHKAYTDGLTKIFNREKCDKVLSKINGNEKSRIIIICFDLNDFKQTNDNEGHAAGDELLIAFAKILNNIYGKIGFVSRIGGDEFLVILKNLTNEEIDKKMYELKNSIKKYNTQHLKYRDAKLSTAYGIAIKEKNEKIDICGLRDKADTEMYKNKINYKNKIDINFIIFL